MFESITGAQILAGLLRSKPVKEEEAEDILADFQEKVDRLDAVVRRHTEKLLSNEDEILRLDQENQKVRERQVKTAIVRDKLVEFIS